MEFLREFNHMIMLFFHKAKSCVKNNGSFLKSFMIERRVRLEYSLVSYLFFIVVELLNSMIMIEANLGIVRKIQPIAN